MQALPTIISKESQRSSDRHDQSSRLFTGQFAPMTRSRQPCLDRRLNLNPSTTKCIFSKNCTSLIRPKKMCLEYMRRESKTVVILKLSRVRWRYVHLILDEIIKVITAECLQHDLEGFSREYYRQLVPL